MPESAVTDHPQTNWLRRFLASPKNSLGKTLAVPFGVSVISALLVGGAAILLRPQYQLNQEINRERNILAAADLLVPGKPVKDLFSQVEPRVVDLASGEYSFDVDVAAVLGAQNARDRIMAVEIPKEKDIAFIKSRLRYAVVYLVIDEGELRAIVLPVSGYGLWSTMYGYIALERDANTIIGLRFYQQGETPGLGGEIDNPKWLQLWPGKEVYDESGNPVIKVIKGQAAVGDGSGTTLLHQVDGISGATLTGQGVTNLLRYWLGPDGFGPYLSRIRNEQEAP